MATIRHLGFVGEVVGPPTTHSCMAILCKNFVTIGIAVLKLGPMIVCRSRLNVLFMGPKFQF